MATIRKTYIVTRTYTYTINKKSNESLEDFHTRVANEIQIFSDKIISALIESSQANFVLESR